METYIIRIWRTPDPGYCGNFQGVLDEIRHDDEGGPDPGAPPESILKVAGSAPLRRMSFNSIEQFRRILGTIGLTGE